MKKGLALLLVLIVAVSGCGKKKKKTEDINTRKDVRKEIDIPVANENIKSFFDEDLGEFALSDDSKKTVENAVDSNIDVANNDYSWMDDVDASGFKKIYFDFDKYALRDDQEKNLVFDVEATKKKIEDAQVAGMPLPLLVIDGHADHAAGSRTYNLALSEKRAKVLADYLVAQGVPEECIKIVGRGSEVPAVVNGRSIDGDREQQAPNRRDELHIVHA